MLRADREAFNFLSQRCQDIRPTVGVAVKPLDALLDDAMRDYQTTFHLLPLPKEQIRSFAMSRGREVLKEDFLPSQKVRANQVAKARGVVPMLHQGATWDV